MSTKDLTQNSSPWIHVDTVNRVKLKLCFLGKALNYLPMNEYSRTLYSP